MELRVGVTADLVSITDDGKLNLVGIFERVVTSRVPAVLSSFHLFARFSARVVEGTEHAAQVALVNADGQDVIPRLPPIPLRFGIVGAGKPLSGQMILHLPNVEFPEFGDYEFQLYVDERYVDSIPLIVEPHRAEP